MNYISIDFIIKEHAKLRKLTGGSNGIRDIGILESAFNAPFMTFDDEDLYVSDIDKIKYHTLYYLICLLNFYMKYCHLQDLYHT